ncbi:MAG: energy-coupling factor transporter transmembrane protein EcfT, partial [Actinomycetes bacterium]|nr:energy-coupling factor transporter transmembrane protein EcfT [Actinomycetes bacterium]
MYLPGSSLLHRADPRTKLLAAIALIIALFSVTAWSALIFVALLTVLLFAL